MEDEGLEERLKGVTPTEKPEIPTAKPALEVELAKVEEHIADQIRRARGDDVLLDLELRKKEKLKQLTGETEATPPRKETRFSAINGEVIQDPEGTLTLEEAIKLAAFQKGQSQPTRSLSNRLDEVLEQVLSKKLAGMLEEGEPESPVRKLIKDLKDTEELKEVLGVKKESPIKEQIAGQSLRPEIIKILLEDERERLKIEKEHEIEMAKLKSERPATEDNEFTQMFMDTLRQSAVGFTQRAPKATKGAAKKEFWANCPYCHEKITFKEKPTGEVTCPHCHGVMKPAPPK